MSKLAEPVTLTPPAELGELSGGSFAVGDGATFDLKAALDEGNGTVVTDDSQVLDHLAALGFTGEGVPEPPQAPAPPPEPSVDPAPPEPTPEPAPAPRQRGGRH